MIISCSSCNLQYDVSTYPPGTQLRCHCGETLRVPEHKLATIRCPSCGGSLPADSRVCQFCNTSLTAKICPKCARAVREDAKFCDGCGSSLQTLSTTTLEASKHKCPRCEMHLVAQMIDGHPVEVCGACMGMWIEHSVLEAIYAAAPKGLTPVKAAQASNEVRLQAAQAGQHKKAYIPCPVCGTMMNPQNYGMHSGVIIDLCREHGVWFDADELNNILAYHAAGGKVTDRVEREKERSRDALKAHRLAMAMEGPKSSTEARMRGGFLSGALKRFTF